MEGWRGDICPGMQHYFEIVVCGFTFRLAVTFEQHYFHLLGRLRAWTWKHLTTTALAQRVLRAMGLPDSSWGSAKVRVRMTGKMVSGEVWGWKD